MGNDTNSPMSSRRSKTTSLIDRVPARRRASCARGRPSRLPLQKVAIRSLLIAFFFAWFTSPLAAQGVKDVWVSASQWPNARTQETFARDAVRLYGAENGTDEEKALAIYYYSLRVMGHGGDFRQGPYGQELEVWDNWMIFRARQALKHCLDRKLGKV